MFFLEHAGSEAVAAVKKVGDFTKVQARVFDAVYAGLKW